MASVGPCPTPIKGMRFMTPSKRLSPIPCNRSTCPACSRRNGMITSAMVGLDAVREQPRVVVTTTTRDRVSPAVLREGQAQLVRRVRELAPDAQYCGFVEWTTGLGERSGGIRRPHQHALWKGLDPVWSREVEAIAKSVWMRLAGADRHQVEEITTPAGAAMYVASHHLKESQAPPPSWGRLRRLRASRGYWALPAVERRQEAARAVRERRMDALARARLEELDLEADLLGVVRDGLSTEPVEVVRVREGRGGALVVLG